MAPTQLGSNFCLTPNYFSSVLAPAVEKRLPAPGSYSAQALDHLTNIGPFLQTVSQDLCEDGRMNDQSARSGLSFMARSSASAIVAGGTIGLASLGLVIGSPFLALAAGAVGLFVLPSLAERAVFGIADFAGELLKGVSRES